MKHAPLAFAVALSVGAIATDAHGTPEDDLAETTQRMAEGKALYEAKRYEEARRKEMQACAIMRTPKCLIALSLAEYRSGHYLDAYTHLTEARAMPNAPTLSPPISYEVQEALDGSYAKLGHLVIDISPEAKVSAPATGHENDHVVVLDGKPITYRPSEKLHVEAGVHRLESRDNGHTVRRDVDALAGQLVSVSLREDVPPPSMLAPIEAPPLKSTSSGTSGARVGVTLALAGVGIASIVGGAVLGASSSSALDDVKASGSCAGAACDPLRSRIDDAHRSGVWSTVLYGTGAAFLLGAGLAWWVMKPSPSSAGTRLHVSPGIGSARLTYQF